MTRTVIEPDQEQSWEGFPWLIYAQIVNNQTKKAVISFNEIQLGPFQRFRTVNNTVIRRENSSPSTDSTHAAQSIEK